MNRNTIAFLVLSNHINEWSLIKKDNIFYIYETKNGRLIGQSSELQDAILKARDFLIREIK